MMPRKNRAAYPATGPTPPLPSCSLVRALSTGSKAWTRTSQIKKIRMPMAMALRNWRVPGRTERTRPSGSPIRMVTPAMNPSSTVPGFAHNVPVRPRGTRDVRRREVG